MEDWGAGLVIGIDPGLDGAVAALAVNGVGARVYDAPTQTVQRPRGPARRRYAPHAMVELLEKLSDLGPVRLVVIEDVGVRPGEGAVGAFSFGHGVGLWHGLLVGVGLPMLTVRPQVWKKAHNLPADKQAVRLTAALRWPALSWDLSRKRDHGRAEALYLAAYALHQIHASTTKET